MTTATTNPAFGEPHAKPALPYAGTSGRGGSAASRDAKAREDSDGTTTARQREAMCALDTAGHIGLTWRELSSSTGLHHGQVTGVLSTLHKAGHIARLALVRRANCSVYVLPENVAGRPVADHGGRKNTPEHEPFVLTADEADLIAKLRAVVNADRDKPTLLVRKASLRAVLAILDRALT